MKLYAAVGDIHGYPKAARAAVDLIRSLNATGIFLGDYVDRGPNSVATMQELIKAKKENKHWVFLMGNHEDMLLDSIDSKTEVNEFSSESVAEYKCYAEEQPDKAQAHLNFLRKLPLYYETKNYIFVHGGLLRSWNTAIEEIPKQELIWSYGVHPEYKGKTIVRGHEVIEQVTVNDNNIQIDTGLCYYGGYLSVVLFSDDCKENNGVNKIYKIDREGNVTAHKI